MKRKMKCHMLISLAMMMIIVITMAFTNANAAEVTLDSDSNLPTGGVQQIEVFGEEVTEAVEAEDISVTAIPYNPLVRSYITPSIPGYSSYGYNWLATSNDPYVQQNRAALVGLYEAFTTFCETAYDSTSNISSLGLINVSALNIPTNSQASLDAANRLIRLVAYCFDADNPQYYFVANSYSYSYYSGTSGYLYTVKPYTRASYDAYSARQRYNGIIEAKFLEYQTLANTVTYDYDKARLVHDKILAETDYAYMNGLPDSNDYAHTIIGVFDLTTNGPVCESYAKAYSYILNRLGIQTIYLSGLGNGGGHAWNVVKLQNAWYYADSTWNDRETTQGDPGNITNDLFYMYYMVGSNNTIFTNAHIPGDVNGTYGWYMYDEPPISSTNFDPNISQFNFITDNGYYGNASWSNGGRYTVKNNYVVGFSSTFDYYRNLTTRNFGTYSMPASGNINVSGISMYLYSYSTYPIYIRQLVQGVDFRVEVEKPYKIGQNRVWIYGIGNSFRGIDFGWITIQ